MHTNNMLAALVGAVILVAIGYALGIDPAPDRAPRDSGADTAAQAARIEALERQVAALTGRPEPRPLSMRMDTRSHHPVAVQKHPGTVGRPIAPIGERQVSTEEMERARRARQQALESTFTREPLDAPAASASERALLEAASSDEVAQIGGTPLDVRTECRASTCRIVARFKPNGEADTWLQGFLLGAGNRIAQAESIMTSAPNGDVLVTIYGRKGRG